MTQAQRLEDAQALAEAINKMILHIPHLPLLQICSDIPGIVVDNGQVVADQVWVNNG